MNTGPQNRALEELRGEFDRSFARPPDGDSSDVVPLLAIRAGGEGLAFETGHITGLLKHRRIVPVPSQAPALLGIAGIRGALVPVYGLALLLGLPAATGEPQWLALAGRQSPIALAFDELEGRVEVRRNSLRKGEGTAAGRHIPQLASVWSSLRGVVSVPGILEEIHKAAVLRRPAKES